MTMHIDYPTVRATPIEAVLHEYKVDFRRQGNMLVAKKCPLPSHTSEEINTFKVSLERNLWTCHSTSCRKGADSKGGDVIDLVCLVENLRPLEAAKKLTELNGHVQKMAKVNTSKADQSTDELVNKPLGWKLPFNPEHPMIQ